MDNMIRPRPRPNVPQTPPPEAVPQSGSAPRAKRRWFHRGFGYIVVALLFGGAGAYAATSYLTAQSYNFQFDSLQIVRPTAAQVKATPSPSVGPAPLPPYDQSIRQQDLDHAFRQIVTNPTTDKATVVYADLNGDRVEDALVSLHLNGAGGYSDAAVYTMVSGQLKQIWRLPAGDALASSQVGLGANQSVLYIGAKTYDGANTRIDTTYNYIWNGSGLVRAQ